MLAQEQKKGALGKPRRTRGIGVTQKVGKVQAGGFSSGAASGALEGVVVAFLSVIACPAVL